MTAQELQQSALSPAAPALLLEWERRPVSRRLLPVALGSVALNLFVFGVLNELAQLPGGAGPENRLSERPQQVTHLVIPRDLTQREPNRNKVAKEVRLENLVAKPEVKPRVPVPPSRPVRTFQAPPPQAPMRKPTAAPYQPPPEAPKLDAAIRPPQALPPADMPQLPPPQNRPPEKPKLAFETPGQNGAANTRGASTGKISIPKLSVEEAIRGAGHSQGGGAVSVGDTETQPSLGDLLRQAPSPPKAQSRLELLSDPMGVDFKPYLIRILASVRRNWLAVIPESAHMGRRGQVALQFAIDRSGQVPKLVIAVPSGAEPLDRAAVAGVSASVPFPPLPAEFKGDQIRLQFTFSYNMH